MRLAFDLGATSGRLIAGTLRDARLELCEILRFPNCMMKRRERLHWDVNALFRVMLDGLSMVAQKYPQGPRSIGTDTWGVDFGLLDASGDLIGLPFAYRDPNNEAALADFTRKMLPRRLYSLTGIQVLSINSVFQLYAQSQQKHSPLGRARKLLFMPDLFNYMLTGVSRTERTIASTSQLLNPRTGNWEPRIFRELGISPSLMPEFVAPGTEVGPLTENVSAKTGLSRVPVIAVAGHDTASAVAAIPVIGDDFAYISSGTWSLMGIESSSPIITARSYKYNFTNEGGVGGTYRVLKNITGLWLLEQCRRSWSAGRTCSYESLIAQAENAEPFRSIVNPDSPELTRRREMPKAIASCCRSTGQPAPETPGQLTRCILESLALAYRKTLEELRTIRREPPIRRIHIVGGGSRNQLLCQFTADATGLPVYAGPAEAAAIGNILVQALAAGEIRDLKELREVVRESFSPKVYEPRRDARWDEAYERFTRLRQQAPGPGN